MSCREYQEYADCDLAGREVEVLHEVATSLQQLSALPQKQHCFAGFDSASVPAISVHDYVQRLWQYMDCSIQCFVISLVYLFRILDKHPDVRLSRYNVHTLTFSCLVVASKFQDDVTRTNLYYARVGGVCPQSLRKLEAMVLKLLDWQAGFAPEEFRQCLELLFCKDRVEELRSRYLCQTNTFFWAALAAEKLTTHLDKSSEPLEASAPGRAQSSPSTCCPESNSDSEWSPKEGNWVASSPWSQCSADDARDSSDSHSPGYRRPPVELSCSVFTGSRGSFGAGAVWTCHCFRGLRLLFSKPEFSRALQYDVA
eukprot:TRINITY_DN78698_c0_g1_i1.p1 TRINITY_DN78698_c0_g1~~TRINITY_DN78698_c0_g1_i1.p1  ORF type:complete len:312 (-),score=55.33 TRINITY_DN78698_c0_g1_i1:48-983(-)